MVVSAGISVVKLVVVVLGLGLTKIFSGSATQPSGSTYSSLSGDMYSGSPLAEW